MKRTPLLIAALAPIVAIASQEAGTQSVDHQQLRNHVQATRILGAEVQSGDGLDVGTVEDIILDQQGNISSVLVQREGNPLGEGRDRWPGGGETDQGGELEAVAERTGDTVESGAEEAGVVDARAETRERAAREGDSEVASEDEGSGMDMAADPNRAETTEMGDDFAELQWSDVSYNADEEVLQLSGSATSALQTVQYDQSSAQTMQGEIRASKLVGLEVNLSDEESFGEVEDIMIDPGSGKASALVVDSMEFFDKERYALPVELQGLNTEEESLTLQLTKQQVEDMGEFEMEDAASTR